MSTGQSEIDFGKKLRDEGIERAVDHADRKITGWSEIAYEHFRQYLRTKEHGFEFMIEDFRKYMGTHLVEPPSLRAYGGIAVRASHDGLIERVGFGTVSNAKAHRCFASVWRKV